MTPLRVLHLVPALFGNDGIFGGGERYAYELARHMAERTPTRLVAFGPNAFKRTDGALSIHCLGPAWHVRGQRANPLHPVLLRELAWANVVHCHQRVVLASSLSALVARLTGKRVFVSDLGGGGWDISAYVNTDRWFHAHLHLSEYSRDLAGHTHWPRARIISGGVDIHRFQPDPGIRREPLVVFVGRLVPHKGIPVLIDALPSGLSLEIIGRSFDNDYTQSLIRRSADKQITFRLDCSDRDIVLAYRRALCAVLPSVYQSEEGHVTKVPELLGQTPLEAMACGTPAIVTNVASLPEVVQDGVTGFVVPPNNPAALGKKLTWMRDHQMEANQMGAAGRERVLAHFTWPAVVERCLQAYTCAS